MPMAVGLFAFLIFWNTANLRGDPLRPDFFLLADAFLHGRTWIDATALAAPWDRIDIGGRTYFHAGPLSAIVLMPLVAIWGVATIAPREGLVNAGLGGVSIALCWALVGRYGSRRLSDRLWIVANPDVVVQGLGHLPPVAARDQRGRYRVSEQPVRYRDTAVGRVMIIVSGDHISIAPGTNAVLTERLRRVYQEVYPVFMLIRVPSPHPLRPAVFRAPPGIRTQNLRIKSRRRT